MRVYRDQADRPSIPQFSQAFQYARWLQAHVQMLGDGFGHHDFVGFRPGFLPSRHDPLGLRTAIRWDDSVFCPATFKDTQDAARIFTDATQRPSFIASWSDWLEPDKHFLTRRKGCRTPPFRVHQDQGRRAGGAFPLDRARNGVAVPIRAGNLHNRGFR